MIRTNKLIGIIISCSLLLSGCATIIGGSSYVAHVSVEDHPNAIIYYNGMQYGRGYATIPVKRADANKLTIAVKEENCDKVTYNYTQRELRIGALVGTIIGWTGITSSGIPLPFGVVVDFATGAIWKPDVREPGVSKVDYKHFNYSIDYKGCKVQPLTGQ